MNSYTLIIVSLKSNNNQHHDILDQLKSSHWKDDLTINIKNDISLNENDFKVSKYSIKSNQEYQQLNQQLHQYFDERKVDFYFHTNQHFNNNERKLAVFDMDSCIIKNECIDEMASLMGVSDRVSDITSRAMAGELDFNQALKERLSLLKGMTIDQLEQVWLKIELNSGSYSLIKALKSFGYKTALVSGGFSYFAFRVASRLEMDFAVSNTLEFDNDNKLTGSVVGDIINAEMKKKITILLSELENIKQHQTISMGDGSNDKLMIQYCDLGVAYHGKPILRQATPFQINHGPLSTLSFYLPNIYNSTNSNSDNSNNSSTNNNSDNIYTIITTKKYIYDTSIHNLLENQALVDQYRNFRSLHL